jgi:hypothetical protein
LITNLYQDKDPCGDNLSTQIVFFIGSPDPSPDYPGLPVTPFCQGPGGTEAPCQDEMIVSPVIDLTHYSSSCDGVQDACFPPDILPFLGGTVLTFTVYVDLPAPNCVFYEWSVRDIDEDGCPGEWYTPPIYYYWENEVYTRSRHDISHIVGSNKMQVALRCVDMCGVWFGVYCDCAEHTPSPWYDNVKIQRYTKQGPQWSYRGLDLFQDNFPEEEFAIESYVRADAANNLNPCDMTEINPGDSIVVTCTSTMGGGIRENPGGPEVYMHVKAEYIGPVNPPWGPKPQYLFGPMLEGTYGHYVSDDGAMWTVIQGDTARVQYVLPVDDKYMFDLNDSLFTRGYMISYYFSALDNAGFRSTLPHDAEAVADLPYPEWGSERYKQVSHVFEFTCLPTGSSSILYVDDFDGRGTFWGMAEQYYNPTFLAVIPADNLPDRYDVNNPSSNVGNGPGSRAKNYHMTTAYSTVMWDSGNLSSGTICDGSTDSGKSQDAQLLNEWLELSDHSCGLWICGDDVASDLTNMGTAPLLTLMTAWCGVDWVGGSYFELTGGFSAGGIMHPMITSAPPPSVFAGPPPDTFYLEGGCPVINDFDLLEAVGSGAHALQYPDHEGLPYYAAIQGEGINTMGWMVRTLWFGFGFMNILDHKRACPIKRNTIMQKGIDWFGTAPTNPDIVDTGEGPPPYRLAQNYPNPFNPVTTIKFDIRDKGHVTIRIYDVAGRLVRTVLDENLKSGPYTATWDGRNESGAKVASGVYFYKLDTKGFVKTRKMVLLR